MGPAMLIAYLLIDAVVYTIFLVVARAAFKKAAGHEPWHDVKGFAVVLAGIWAGNNATRPLRLAGAAALTPAIEWAIDKIQRRFVLTRPMAAFCLLVAIGTCAVFAVGLWIALVP